MARASVVAADLILVYFDVDRCNLARQVVHFGSPVEWMNFLNFPNVLSRLSSGDFPPTHDAAFEQRAPGSGVGWGHLQW